MISAKTIISTISTLSVLTASIFYAYNRPSSTYSSSTSTTDSDDENEIDQYVQLPEFLDDRFIRRQFQRRKRMHDMEEAQFFQEHKDRSPYKHLERNEDQSDINFIRELEAQRKHLGSQCNFMFHRSCGATDGISTYMPLGSLSSNRRKELVRRCRRRVNSGAKLTWNYIPNESQVVDVEELRKKEEEEMERKRLISDITGLPSAVSVASSFLTNPMPGILVSGGRGLLLDC